MLHMNVLPAAPRKNVPRAQAAGGLDRITIQYAGQAVILTNAMENATKIMIVFRFRESHPVIPHAEHSAYRVISIHLINSERLCEQD